jgi:hypothetical protein
MVRLVDVDGINLFFREAIQDVFDSERANRLWAGGSSKSVSLED